jgi:dTMP kinase
MESTSSGILISVEGIDGAGKSTLVKLLHKKMVQDKLDVIVTKEPGGSKLGKYLRQLLHAQQLPICSKAEYLLFAADRAQHMSELVLPALAEGKLVLSDRMADSSLAYQAFARGLDQEVIRFVNQWAMEHQEPDLIVFLDISVDIAFERISKRGAISSFEQEVSFLEKVRAGFLNIFASKKQVITIDGSLEQNLLFETAYAQISSFLTQRWAQGQ